MDKRIVDNVEEFKEEKKKERKIIKIERKFVEENQK